MRSHLISKSESGSHIFVQMLDFFNLSNQSGIETDLKVLLSLNVFLIFFSQFVVFFEKHIIGLFGLLFFLSGEKIVVYFAQIEFRNVDLGGSWDHVGLVESSQRNSIDFIRPSGQNQTGLQLL